MMKVTLKNMDTGVIKTSPTGYSWTTLFFAIFAAFYNKLYIKDLLSKRYTYANEETRQYLIEKGIIQE